VYNLLLSCITFERGKLAILIIGVYILTGLTHQINRRNVTVFIYYALFVKWLLDTTRLSTVIDGLVLSNQWLIINVMFMK